MSASKAEEIVRKLAEVLSELQSYVASAKADVSKEEGGFGEKVEEFLAKHKTFTKRDLMEAFGISRSTAFKYLRGLLASGKVVRFGCEASTGGRPALVYQVNTPSSDRAAPGIRSLVSLRHPFTLKDAMSVLGCRYYTAYDLVKRLEKLRLVERVNEGHRPAVWKVVQV